MDMNCIYSAKCPCIHWIFKSLKRFACVMNPAMLFNTYFKYINVFLLTTHYYKPNKGINVYRTHKNKIGF